VSPTAVIYAPELLGLRRGAGRSGLGLTTDVQKGLPLSTLDRIVHAVAPHDSTFAFRIVPRATLARRRAQGARLTPEESARVARLAEVWAFARDVWKGDDDAARHWLFEPHMILEDRRPVDVVLMNEFGRTLVQDILGRIKYSTGL
jgi:putative toxin-antitoxin system antitoxin component (TIGR02293 family)